MILFLLNMIAEPGTGTVEKAADSLIERGVLGSLVVLAVAFAMYAVYKWNQVNEARVKDQKEASKDITQLAGGVKDALKDMAEALENTQEEGKKNSIAVDRLERTIDNVVRDAVRWGYRRPTPPAGTPRSGG